MGASCSEAPHRQQIPNLPPLALGEGDCKSQTLSIRFGEVERIKSNSPHARSLYRFILPVKTTNEIIKVECKVVSDYSDKLTLSVPLLSGVEDVRAELASLPIVDLHDPQSTRQHLFKYVVRGEGTGDQHVTVKIYQFKDYHDPVFLNGLYQAYLYGLMDQYCRGNTLKDLFIMEKTKPCSLVFVFGAYMHTLEDVLHYRWASSLPYSIQEQNYIATQLVRKYEHLKTNNIVHRDIRPGKIYLANPRSTFNTRRDVPSSNGYQFLNLETARALTSAELRLSKQNDNQLQLTTRGTPGQCSNAVSELLRQGQQLGFYDPFHNDRVQLANTLCMLTGLEPAPTAEDHSKLKETNPNLHALIAGLVDPSADMGSLLRTFEQSVGNNTKFGEVITDSDYNICNSEMPLLMRSCPSYQTDQAVTEAMLALDQRDLFLPRLSGIIETNSLEGRPFQNIAILQRLGDHFQALGVPASAYYDEEVRLMIELSQDLRERGFETNGIAEQMRRVHSDKLMSKFKDVNQEVEYNIEIAYALSGQLRQADALRLVNQTLKKVGTSDQLVPAVQLKLLRIKGILEPSPSESQLSFQKGLEGSVRRNFPSELQMLDSKSSFQYLLARLKIEAASRMHSYNQTEFKIKLLAQSQQLLLNAKETKGNIPLKHPTPLAKIYEATGDLAAVREDSIGAAENYERAFRLYESADSQISATLKVNLLEKLRYHYENQRGESMRVQKLLHSLNRRKEQERDNRSVYFWIRKMKDEQVKKSYGPGPGVIQQQPDEDDIGF